MDSKFGQDKISYSYKVNNSWNLIEPLFFLQTSSKRYNQRRKSRRVEDQEIKKINIKLILILLLRGYVRCKNKETEEKQ